MNGGDSGCHGGYNGGVSNHINYHKHPCLYKPATPPLTATDTLLCARTKLDPQTQNHEINQASFGSSNAVSDYSSWSNSSLETCLQSVNSFAVDVNGDHVFTNNNGSLEGQRTHQIFDRNQESKSKGGNSISKVLIKGRWTDEEDNELIRLVKGYGERKWTLIAKKMTGRAGKQCRERWHNHLRPGIKKCEWSEEEVRMLIDAHQKVGNKWTKIAKLIPGRTENSIKNQWNATKRKQITKRVKKSDAKDIKHSKPTLLLQDYIRSKTSDHSVNSNSSNSTITAAAAATTTGDSTNVGTELTNSSNNTFDHDPSIEISQSYDEELAFMQALFQTTTTTATSGHVSEQKWSTIDPLGFSGNSQYGFSSTSYDENWNVFLNNQYLYHEDDVLQTLVDVSHLEEAIVMAGSGYHVHG